ncbi:MAG: pitrilysin family protein, partial [Bryobacteraceae bacterium]
DAAEVAKTIEQQIGAALAAKDEPRTAAQLYFRPFYFGAAHPYGHPASGDELSLKAITRDSIVGTHRRLYVARNVHIVAVGDFDPSAFALRIEKAFASIPSGSRFDWTSASTVSHTQPRLLLVDKPDATQTYFTIALPGIDRKHRDRTVLDLVNTLFGGRFTSLLNDELRVNSGLTYGAGSRVQTDRLPGAIAIASFTKTESTVPAIDLAVEVLGRFHDNGITAAQLQSAKAYVKGTFPPRALETTGQVAELIGELDLFGLSRGEIDDMFSRIDAVTLEQANVAIRRYFVPERLQFCLIGKAAEIAKDVEKYADHRRVIPLASPGVRVPNF